MGPLYLGLSAVGWHVMTQTVWGQVAAAFLLVTIVLAVSYVVYQIVVLVRRRVREQRPKTTISRPVAHYLKNLRRSTKRQSTAPSTAVRKHSTDAKSFGAFLGAFASPPTAAQRKLLSQWDIVAVDPAQEGTLAALNSEPPASEHVLARLDMRTLATVDASAPGESTMKSLVALTTAMDTYVKKAASSQFSSPFTGVLLAGFNKYFSPPVVNELARYVQDLGLDLWLELSYPEYLPEEDARQINMHLIQGLVYCNGTIRPDGDRQNYFQMTAMRQVMRAMAAQRVSHSPALVMWEIVDDGMPLQYAVVTRTFSWCTYNSASCWVGHASALIDAEAAETDYIPAKPLGALMWLKDEKNMKAHDVWRVNDEICLTSADRSDLYRSAASFVPDLETRLRLLPPTANPPQRGICFTAASLRPPPSLSDNYSAVSPLSASATSSDFTGLGCFQLGHDATYAEFAELRLGQKNLKDLNLLGRVKGEELATACQQIAALQGAKELSHAAADAVQDLLELLSTAEDPDSPRLRIFTGLHSGFQAVSGTQYWGLYDYEPAGECLDLYLSNKAKQRAGAILHTFLSSRQITRAECFMVEQVMAERTGTMTAWKLSPRIVQDVETLSPPEAILLARRIQSSRDSSSILPRIRDCIEHALVDVPTLTQLRAIESGGYLGGTVSAEEVVHTRLAWLAAKGCAVPDAGEAMYVFNEVYARLYAVLMNNESDVYATLGDVMQKLVAPGRIDAGVDIFALAVFSAFRRLSVDELYLEVLDRNVYPNHSTDQAGCFAENFGLGSRCDSFFDTTPRTIGRIIADRQREYYRQYQPPRRPDVFTELPTAYFAMQVDADPEDGKQTVPFYYRVTFFGIFALPALIDVMLLTTIGRGLYLTTYMTSEQKTMATTALMLSLLMSGSFGVWICSGGTYYFFANAFPAMNLFIMTRFVAGVAVTLLTALGGFLVVVFLHNIHAALVFLFYFSMLSTYMLVLNALSIYQQPGSDFLSGRTTIICCIPILFISPILSMWVQHDIVVYVPVLATFLVALLIGARYTMSNWSTWYLRIPSVTDAEIIAWYRGHAKGGEAAELADMRDNDVMPRARAAIHAAVLHEKRRWKLLTRSHAEPIVTKLAKGYGATVFLMQWYSKHKRSRMPLVYSTTWNLTLKAGLENMTNMQKGLKLHNAFLHWRCTSHDIWSGVLYFVVALLDKWVALFTGSSLVGLSAASSETFRLGVGFGLCYYLFGAVALDIVSQPLWTAANEKSSEPITSLAGLQSSTANGVIGRRRLYWRSLAKFFFLHLWGTALFTALIWVFKDYGDNTIMFLGYVVAYTGLLWYQYNKIWSDTHGAVPLAIGGLVGLPVGLALHLCRPDFGFSGVICLGSATWTACLVSFWTANLGFLPFSASTKYHAPPSRLDESTAVYSAGQLDPAPEVSQATLRQLFDASQRFVPADERFFVQPANHPGTRVLELLQPRSRDMSTVPAPLAAAFPAANILLNTAYHSFEAGRIVVELVSARHLQPSDVHVTHVVRKTDDFVSVVVVSSIDRFSEQTLNSHQQWHAIAEAVVQATAEHLMGLSHTDAMLAGLLVVDHINGIEVSATESAKLLLKNVSAERERVLREGDRTLLQHVLLGVDSEREWDNLPEVARRLLLKRSCGGASPLSDDEITWLRERIGADEDEKYDYTAVSTHVARCELAVSLTRATLTYAVGHGGAASDKESMEVPYDAGASSTSLAGIAPARTSPLQKLRTCVKFLILSLTADPEYQRELSYVSEGVPPFVRWPVMFFLNTIWAYCKLLQSILVPVILFSGRDSVAQIRHLIKGMSTVLHKNRMVSESFTGVSTWFWITLDDGSLRLAQYAGRLVEEPQGLAKLQSVNTYTDTLVLTQREIYGKGGKVTSAYVYEYEDRGSRLPLQRRCTAGPDEGELVQYDHRGYITTGSAMRGINKVTWTLWYRKSAKHEDELLWAEYVFPHVTIKVLWSMPPRNPHKRLEQWIPFSTVTEATFIQGDDVYHASWDYEHKFHPEVAVTLNGQAIDTPLMIKEDWFHVLDKPENCSFLSENPLLSFASIRTNPVTRFFRLNVKHYPIPTSVARTQLWKAWRSSREIDAISARWLDEKLLRRDRIMRRYWRLRDFGRLDTATAYLDAHIDTIMARVDIDPQTSAWTLLAYKSSDLYGFGQGGDTAINTRKIESQLWSSEDELHILAMDTSTWPNDPGGVSACRRDMVNDLRTIKWHVVAESANDYGVPRFQIERNVQSLTLLPLWGLDFLNPTHGVLETCLDSAVVQRSLNTRAADIAQNFLPILTSLVRCARTIHLDRQDVEEATRALVDLNTYFETSRNWNDVWKHPLVQQRWRELWLVDEADALNIGEWWDYEMPTLKQLDEALNLWCRYLFIFSLPVPEHIPDVFQASHHFTGATYGIVCKAKRSCSLHIWDHCISFREFTNFMSSAVSFDSPFVNSSLISLTHLSCVLLEHHADVVLPCCDYFNPGWEVELGTAEGVLEHRHTFARKIDPVVNGICNMEKFEPIKTIKTETPTVVMLSHIQYAKDIKNAIMATDIIVNKWGFTDYRLHVYGDQERAATIATECQELIASKNLQDHCILKGLGNPSVVLQDAWLFLNSSISEGLPLAMGEAALTGVPVVCTDVGASYCVVTDRATGDRFSEVVSPNDSESLARAQISVMALLGPWAAYAGDAPGEAVPVLEYPMPTPAQVQAISARMYAKTEQRRALGMRGRQNVLNNFSSERYLREHEQMLWVGKQNSPVNRARMAAMAAATAAAGGAGALGTASPRSSLVKASYTVRSRPVSRLTPESWISLTGEDETVRGWRSGLTSSATSVRSYFRDKSGKLLGSEPPSDPVSSSASFIV